jgi:thiol-disulfide isomerase/thioredoxin
MMKRIILKLFCCTIFLTVLNAKGQEVVKWKLEDLNSAISKADKPTVFNFWATFCKPCLQELPYFQELVKKYDSSGVQLVLISLDLPEAYPQKIRTFARQHQFSAALKYLDETNADVFCPAVDSTWSGSIPASLFINNKTGYRKFFEVQLTRQNFEAELNRMIGIRL